MSTAPHRRPGEHGFTLVEVLVAATILVVGVLGVLAMLDGANRATARTKAREGGVNLAREAIEAVRAVPYPDLLPGQIESELKAQPGLADASPDTGWNIKRRGITYTVVASVCSVDDGTMPTTDGYGNHTGGFFCADSGTTGTTDNNPDDYKRVTLDVTWKDHAKVHKARQEAVINNPGSAFAPAVKTLAPNAPSPITSATTKFITFTATTSRADEVRWSLDNVQQGVATPTTSAKTTWKFDWDITGVVDGTYMVSAEAFDQFGESGTARTYTMQLNRYAPVLPSNFAGGRNPLWGPTFAEFEWSPNPERDVVGYRVYRMAPTAVAPSTADTVVCETKAEDAAPTLCHDDSIPAGQTFRYYVVAVAPNHLGGGFEESVRPSLAGTLVVGDGTPPSFASDAVTGTRDGNGTTLNWTAATDADGIRYYRIYRDDNTSWTMRVDRTGSGADTGLTDPDGAATSHRYWITAVDNKLAESDFVPPGGIAP